MKITITVTAPGVVRDILKQAGIPHSILKQIRLQDIATVNGQIVKNHTELSAGDTIIVDIPEKINDNIVASFEPLEVLYEDEYLLCVVKPHNLAVHPSRKHFTDNLASYLKGYYERKGLHANIHIVTRLDHPTGGIVVVAKYGFVHGLMQRIAIERLYLAVLEGQLDGHGIINAPIGRPEARSIKRAIMPDGKHAISEYWSLGVNVNSLVLAKLHTGRTHQLRLHFASLGHPVLGDALYGTKAAVMRLSCVHVGFVHPITKQVISLTHLPDQYEEVICQI